MDAFYTGLLANFGILAMCGLLLASIAPIWRNQRNGLIRYQLIAGMVFGLTTAALILFSTSFVGGTVFDSRAAPAILSGVIGGPWAALITALLGGAARLHIGGEWVLPGVISVVFYCLFGLVYSFALDRVFHRKVSMAHLAPLGAICTIAAIPIFFIGMPYAAAVAVIEAVFVALIVTNTISVAALGVTLIQSARTAADRQELLIMHSALKRAANGVIITDASAARRIIYANEAAAKITGYKATELLGRSTDIFFGEDAQSEKRRIVRAAAEAGEECSDTFINYRKDGSAFHNHVNLAPVYSRRGHISHFVSVFADVSREMQVQNVLKTVSGQIPTALIYLNLDCQVEFINDAGVRLLALPDRNFRRRPLHEVVPPPILDVLARFIIAAENGREKRAESDCRCPMGILTPG